MQRCSNSLFLGKGGCTRTQGTGSAFRAGRAQQPQHILRGFLNPLCWDWKGSWHSHAPRDAWKTGWWDKMIQRRLGHAEKVSI